MDVRGVLTEAFGRVTELYDGVADGLDEDALAYRPGGTGNPIGWLLWHLARVQDDHVADVAGREQTWTAEGWHERFGLPLAADATGYGHTSGQAAEVKGVKATELQGYYDAVHRATLAYVATLAPADLDRIVDTNWDPAVTLGVRLVSVANDNQQHTGQAAYIRGLFASF